MIMRTGRNQRGAILIVALLFLTILTILGVTAMTTTTHEEKMAGYSRDTALAFQAAEAALRDGRRDICGIDCVIPPFNAPRDPAIYKGRGFGPGDTRDGSCGTSVVPPQTVGLCQPLMYDASTKIPPPFNTRVTLTDTVSALQPFASVQYGTYTGALMPATLLSRMPRYFIEVLCYQEVGEGFGGASGGDFCHFYRITGIGYGGNPNTRVVVQEIFLKP